MLTQPYCFPTISGLYEMCAAGGSFSKSYWPRLLFDPYEMIFCCDQSLIFNDLLFPFVNDPIMLDPRLSIPHAMLQRNFLYRNKSLIREHHLPLSNTGQRCLLPFLPEFTGYKDAFAFILLIVVLLIKPTGLLGKNQGEKV